MISICGLVVHAKGEAAQRVRACMEKLDGVDVHAEAPGGRLVVTVETDDENSTIALLDHVAGIDGVLSTALTYSHHEDETNEVGVTS